MMKTPTSRAGRARRRTAGVTLIEMIVALGIVSMIAMLALPRFQAATPRLQMRAAAESLRADFRTTRNAALRLNRETALTVDVEAGVWRGEGVGGEAPEGVALTLETALQERVSEQIGRIRFFPEGGATGGVVEMRDGDTVFEVRVDWFDGRVAVAEIDPE